MEDLSRLRDLLSVSQTSLRVWKSCFRSSMCEDIILWHALAIIAEKKGWTQQTLSSSPWCTSISRAPSPPWLTILKPACWEWSHFEGSGVQVGRGTTDNRPGLPTSKESGSCPGAGVCTIISPNDTNLSVWIQGQAPCFLRHGTPQFDATVTWQKWEKFSDEGRRFSRLCEYCIIPRWGYAQCIST